MNYRYNEDIDKAMNYLLDNYEFEGITEHIAYLNGIRIWVGNKPYASIRFDYPIINNYRPSRLTIQKGIKKLGDHKPTIIREMVTKYTGYEY